MRLWPTSLRGQTLLAVAIALLVTQAITAVLLYRADENRRQGDILNRAAFGLLLGSDQSIIQRRGARWQGPRTQRQGSQPVRTTAKGGNRGGVRSHAGRDVRSGPGSLS